MSVGIHSECHHRQRRGLEVVDNAELQIVSVEVETETFLSVRMTAQTLEVRVIVVAVAQETESSDEVNALCEADLHTWCHTNLPCIVAVAFHAVILSLVSVDSETCIQKE